MWRRSRAAGIEAFGIGQSPWCSRAGSGLGSWDGSGGGGGAGMAGSTTVTALTRRVLDGGD